MSIIYKTMKAEAIQLDCGLWVRKAEKPEKKAVHLMIWQPKATNPYFNYLVKPEEVEARIKMAVDCLNKHKETILARKLANKMTPEKLESVKIGDIFYSSWGYEQTNIDFYQVVSKSGWMLTLHPICSDLIERDHSDSGRVMPIKDKFKGSTLNKRLTSVGSTVCITISTFSTAFLWDGQPKECSWWY